MRSKTYTVEERDSVELLSKEREPLQSEYIDELIIEGEFKGENEIQLVDQMEILKAEKPDNEIKFIDELNISSIEKEH